MLWPNILSVLIIEKKPVPKDTGLKPIYTDWRTVYRSDGSNILVDFKTDENQL
jgi:hypothetical protein